MASSMAQARYGWRSSKTKDIASGITDSLGTLGIYFVIMFIAVVFALFFTRRFAPQWPKLLAVPCLVAILVMFVGQFYKAINGQMYKVQPGSASLASA